ncbi:MAG TPA: AraC family transcriptional regulator [Blastococcus sp.]|nr:AraC family transcriptional regulator [Blastococcus sp.]
MTGERRPAPPVTGTTPPIVRAHPDLQFATCDPAEAHAFLRRAYTDNRMRITGTTAGFRMTHTHLDAGAFSLATMTHAMTVEHDAEPLGRLLVGRVADGRFYRRTCGEELRAGPGDVFIAAPPDRPVTVGWDDVGLHLLTLDPAVLDDVAGREPADQGSTEVRFTAWTPVSAPAARLCSDVLDHLALDVLGNPAAAHHPLVIDSGARMLAAALLHAFPCDTTADRPLRPPDQSLAALRRALDYIDTHAAEPIGLADIAAAAHLSVRGLQRAFRRHLDTTPTAQLRLARLDRAHQELLATHPTSGTSLAATALRWGFTRPDRFTRLYRETYGHRPEHDLQR